MHDRKHPPSCEPPALDSPHLRPPSGTRLLFPESSQPNCKAPPGPGKASSLVNFTEIEGIGLRSRGPPMEKLKKRCFLCCFSLKGSRKASNRAARLVSWEQGQRR